MGKIFVEHCNGKLFYECKSCKTSIANKCDIISTEFSCTHGRAYLFKRVVNIVYGECKVKAGMHIIRLADCKVCGKTLGWKYEDEDCEYPEYREKQMTVLDWSLIKYCAGFEDSVVNVN